jgi:hypothetical protein
LQPDGKIMAKKYACKTKGCSDRRKKFGQVARNARKVCIAGTDTVSAFNACLSQMMRDGLSSKTAAKPRSRTRK